MIHVSLCDVVRWTKSCCLYCRPLGTTVQHPTFTSIKLKAPKRLKCFSWNYLVSRLWHAMNQMAMWNRHWIGSQCHSMLREIRRLFFRSSVHSTPRLFATSDRTIKILPCFTALKNEIPNHLALSRLWHAMNQLARTWNRHWKGPRCHSMLREIWQNPILLLHRVEKWNPKLPCSLTFSCYE